PAREGWVVLVIRDVPETRRLDRVRRDFVANASHELKTPAASIQAAAETIRTAAREDPSVIPPTAPHGRTPPAASIQAAAETIRTAAAEDPSVIPRFASQLEREAARLSRIVSALLDLSRLESGSVLDEAVALDAIVRDEGERVEEPAAEGGGRVLGGAGARARA